MNTITPKNRFHLYVILLALSLLFLSTEVVFAEAGIQSTLSHKTIPLNRAALLSVTVNGSQTAEVKIPDIEGVVLHQRGSSRQFSMINGQSTSSVTYNYLVQGEKKGKYTIPPIQSSIDGKKVQSEPINFEIVDPVTNQSPTQQQRNFQNQGQQQPQRQQQTLAKDLKTSDIAFLEVTAKRKNYLGESVPAVIKAYFNSSVRIEPGSISLPAFSGEGLSMMPLSREPEQTQEERNGQIWHVLTWDTTVSGIKSGKQTATLSMNAVAMIPEQGRNRQRMRDPFGSLFGNSAFDDPFFDSVFTRFVQKPLNIQKKVGFDIKSLPDEGKPTDFAGAVGDFDIGVSTRIQTIEVGEPFVVTITITGAGNFDMVNIPEFPVDQAFRTYPPTEKFDAIGNRGGGEKSFEQAVVIRDNRITEIPALKFSYFDPTAKKYVTKTTAPIPIKVTGISHNTLPTKAPQTVNTVQQEGAAETNSITSKIPLKVEIGSFTGDTRPLPARTWFQLVCLALLLCTALLAITRFILNRKTESKRARQKAAKNRLAGDLAKVDSARKKGDAKLFLNASRVAIQNQLARKCEMHPSAVSLTEIRRVLPESSALITIFARADHARYGGNMPGSSEMHSLYFQLKEALEKLQ